MVCQFEICDFVIGLLNMLTQIVLFDRLVLLIRIWRSWAAHAVVPVCRQRARDMASALDNNARAIQLLMSLIAWRIVLDESLKIYFEYV